jgi:rhodanese-related sulfurtransferase
VYSKGFTRLALLTVLALGALVAPPGRAQSAAGAPFVSATTIPQSHLIQPAQLSQILKSGTREKPLIFQVGSRLMFSEEHIPAAQYAGPGSQASGIQSLENVVAALPKTSNIVLYCGCCPWNRCPNVGPAFKRMRELGFTNVKVLYLANNFGDDWVSKGYPAIKGK